MNKIISIVSATLLAIVVSANCFGQGKPISTPQNFQNPFNTGGKKITTLISAAPQQQTPVAEKEKLKIEVEKDGVFHRSLSKYNISRESLTGNFNSYLNLDKQYTFKQISERTDDIGFTHVNYQQLYQGIPISGCLVMLHFKDGKANSINGQIAQKQEIDIAQNIDEKQAYSIAKAYMNASELLNEYPIKLVIAPIPTENGFGYKLVYKVRIDVANPLQMANVMVDAASGEVLNKISLIAHADTPGTAQTLYSGTQNIICDSYNGYYRLRDNGRKIETYDATNAQQGVDFTNSSTNWGIPPKLISFTITNVSQSWWYTAFADEQPDLFISIKDGSNNIVYTSGYLNNTFPSVTFNNLNIYLTNPPYTVEVWDYDAVGGNDFGGSYTISSNAGTFNWSGNGNNGYYSVFLQSNPALDVHWGMEKIFDFYSSVFSRNSYDGNGGIIKQYLNPSIMQGSNANNAKAFPPPYNFIAYGMGDGSLMNPVVGLDIEGHEFTHLVVANNGKGGLDYQGESGALNESFADIFGTCIEFYAKPSTANWTLFEDFTLIPPYYTRSMSNPNSGLEGKADTYQGQYWINPSNLSDDNGGVHTNSGVQNYWFYLLSQGGSGTNDLGNSYSVTGIGINQARQIVYRNLMNYLTPNSNYLAAYNSSLQAAEDLYGNPSTQYNAVRAAWYAVGIGSNPNTYCSGTTVLTANSGTVTDGSGSANYNNNSNCKWIIAPPGATQITLNFTSFNLENGYDTVFVYGGTDTTSTPLKYTGTTLPPQIQTPAGIGACLVKFKTDASVTAGGWSFNYTSSGITPACSGVTLLSTPSGSFSDGSGSSNYGNNLNCYWYIAPPCATSVTLSLSQFNTEQNYDGIIVYDDIYGTNQLAVYSGTSLPPSVTSNTGTMLVYFVSDYANTYQGFTANYTSTGSAYCSGTTTLNTSDWGTITDGSGTNNYCNNMECSWLIQPPQATSVTLEFNSFDLEVTPGGSQTLYDYVEVYNGVNANAPLLGRFAGANIPNPVTSTGGSMFVRFVTDVAVTAQGFSATYTSTTNPYCNGLTTLTAPSGNLSDGSGFNQYANNAQCSWLIQPPNATAITLSFVDFNTEQNKDGVVVYDGANNSASILGRFSGNNIPNPITTTGGSMFIEFASDATIRGEGWTANYTSTIPVIAPVANFSANSTILCAGQCVDFTDYSTNTPTSWLWSFPGSSTPTSTDKNPSNICYPSPGVYNVQLVATNSAGGNTRTNHGYITVNPTPSIPVVAANPSTTICQGINTTLSVSNPCNGCNYTWQPNGSTGQSISVNLANDYTVIASNSCGQSTATTTVTVNPQAVVPIIAANPSTNICQGETTVLSVSNPCSGCAYTWQPIGISGQTISTSTSGNYTATAINSCSQAISQIAAVTVLEQPTIPIVTANPSAIICQGKSTVLTVSNPCSGCNYEWSPYSSTSISKTVDIPANYTVTATNSCGQIASAPTTVLVKPLPPLPNITVNGNTLSSSAVSGNQWYLNGSPIGGADQQIFIAQQSGDYQVMVKDGNNCQSQSGVVSVMVTGIKNVETKSFVAVYPNPTTGNVNIQFSKEQKNVAVELFDVAGKLVMNQALNNVSPNEVHSFSISALPNGIYQLRLNANGGFSHHRLVLAK
ncbi:MAG: hypothetical protein BGO32_04440 [Bacteroidetes bacterium 37-13]|nr:MAG: hypothetical protein BGO32_04440 [Bacteroidetes bacterium 37-13]